MIKSSIKIVFVEPLLIPTSSAISWTIKWWSSMIDVCTLSMTSAWPFRMLVTVRQHVAIFKVVEPHFNLSDPPLHHRRKTAKFWGLFPLGYPQVSDKTWCSITVPSVLSPWAKREYDEHMLRHSVIWQQQTHAVVLRGSKKSHMHMKVSSTTMPSYLQWEKIVGYFWNRPSMIHLDIITVSWMTMVNPVQRKLPLCVWDQSLYTDFPADTTYTDLFRNIVFINYNLCRI
jgi:hypothetical protein